MNIIEALYLGDTCLKSKLYGKHIQFIKLADSEKMIQEKLLEALSGEYLDLFKAYINIQSELSEIAYDEKFAAGFKPGVTLTATKIVDNKKSFVMNYMPSS